MNDQYCQMIVFCNPGIQRKYERAERKDILRWGIKKTVRRSELGEQRNISHNQLRNPLFYATSDWLYSSTLYFSHI